MESVRAAVLYLKWQGSRPAAWALWDSGGFWCPLVLGTQKRPAASPAVRAPWGVRPFRPRPEDHQVPVPATSPFALLDAERDQPVGYRNGCGGT